MGSNGCRSPMDVLIIGAGATGLFIAQGLLKAGFNVRVFERDTKDASTRRPRDWSMGLHWARDYFEEILPEEIMKDIHLISTDPWSEILSTDEYKYALTEEQMKTFPMVNGKTGDLIVNMPVATSRRASRKKTKDLFSRGIEIEYNKRLATLETVQGGVRCLFEDGTVAEGDVLIGADGINSRVRSFLLPVEKNELEQLPTIMYNFTQKYTREQADFLRRSLHPNFKYAMHPDLHVAYTFAILDVPEIHEPETWTFQFLIDQWGTTKHFDTMEERQQHVKWITSQFCEPFKSAGQWIKDDTYLFPDTIRHMPNLVPWDTQKGRVTLAGDAAHPMAPYRGQGLNNGLRDGYNLVQALKSVKDGSKDLESAMDDYTAEVVSRGKGEIKRSALQGEANHNYDLLMESAVFSLGMHKVDE